MTQVLPIPIYLALKPAVLPILGPRLQQASQCSPYPIAEEAGGSGVSREDLDKRQMLMFGKDQQEQPQHANTGDLQGRGLRIAYSLP